MVARLSEMPNIWAAESAVAKGSKNQLAGIHAPRLALRGQLLLERATSLADVSVGGRGIPGFAGVPLHVAENACRHTADSLLRDRVFAAIANDGSICMRLPEEIGDDLVENGLCVRAGKNLLTWPVGNDHQLEVSWRILLHAYWNVTGVAPKHARRLWSEFVIQH